MMARRWIWAVLLALVIAGTPRAKEIRSSGPAPANVMTLRDVASVTHAESPAANLDASAAPDSATPDSTVTPASDPATSATAGDPAAPDAALPNAPQAKKPIVGYQRPSEHVKLVNYLFDAYGPFPLVGSALVAGINQADNSPRDWDQGLRGYGRRWGSDFGIAAITTTTRYGLAEIFHEDTLYYRCECSGAFPRLRHALISTLTGRRGEDGHRVFSVPSLVAPYVGAMVAVHAWYPERYDSSDAFRQANYSLLAYAAGNVVLEFFPSGPHSLLSKFHLQNRHSAPSN
jgi:hypothetical protein